RGLARWAADLRRTRLADRDEDVEAVGERPAEAALVPAHGERRATALRIGLATPARAGVGGGDQHEATGQAAVAAGTGDRDPAALERRSQRLQRVAAELAELVEEEDAAVGERCLSRSRRVASTDYSGGADGVMGPRERAAAAESVVEAPAGTCDPCDLQCLLGAEGRQDRGQAARSERLACPRRADHQEAVAPRRPN